MDPRRGQGPPQATPATAEQGGSLCGAPEETSPGVTLSDSLIVSRRRSTGMLPTATVRLDRENISSIGKLRRLEEIHSLYLQQNRIEKIENLDSFPNLRFLCLAGNRIQRVENLQALPHLSALDLSHNQIQVLDTEELPRSLRILDLTGNECTWQDGYRELVVAALPYLLQLDSRPIPANAAEEKTAGGSSSSQEEEEEDEDLLPELRIPFTADKDFFVELHRELAGRSRRRRKRTLEEHRARLEELRERQNLLLGPASDGAPMMGQPRSAICRQTEPRTQLSPLLESSASQPAPGGIQPLSKALEKETRARGAVSRQLAQISRSSSGEVQSQE